MSTTDRVDNYPGFDDGIDGFELGERMQKGAERFGAVTLFEEATGVELKGERKIVRTDAGELTARAAVRATGAQGCRGCRPPSSGGMGRGNGAIGQTWGQAARGHTGLAAGQGGRAGR